MTSTRSTGRVNETPIINGSEFKCLLQSLSDSWDLGLYNLQGSDSPSRRQKAVAGTDLELGETCIRKLSLIFFSQRKIEIGFILDSLLKEFDTAAGRLLPRWTRDRDSSSRLARPQRTLTTDERLLLQQCLSSILTPKFEEARRITRTTRSISRSLSDTSNLGESIPTTPKNSHLHQDIDDRPISLDLGQQKPTNHHQKRRSNEFEDLNAKKDEVFKRPRIPCEKPVNEINKAIDDVLTRTISSGFRDWHQTKPIKNQPAQSFLGTASTAAGTSFSRLNEKTFQSDNTSFASEASSVFSVPPKNTEYMPTSSLTSTQTTVDFGEPDQDETDLCISMLREAENTRPSSSSSCYGSSFAEEDLGSSALEQLKTVPQGDITRVAMETSPSDENGSIWYPELPDVLPAPLKRLDNSLGDIFPRLPKGLIDAPLAVRYEVTRVFLHCKADILKYAWPASKNLENYDALWKHLKGLPLLKGKVFPQKSSEEAWKAALKDFKVGIKGVVMTGSCRYDHSSTNGPLFSFGLEPLKIDNTHRFGRRFGNDRFFEISMPSLQGSKIPPLLKATGEDGFHLVIQWLVEGAHEFLGRLWQPFYAKDSRSRKSVLKKSILDDVEKTPVSQTVYLFAVNGQDFANHLTTSTGKTKRLPEKDEPLDRHTELSVRGLINWMIPIDVNKCQPALKFFSRISLGLSKTIPTCVVKKIIERNKDLLSETGKVMNDGCGRMSRDMAVVVAQQLGLGLNDIPTAFQARIGPAKGLWVVDVSKKARDGIWIETYPSQRKWIRHNTAFDEDDLKTFEVIKYSKPLRSADLNLQFLPILEARASEPREMREALSMHLENGLNYRISSQKAAMDDPKALRKWAKDVNPSIDDRLLAGRVLFQGAIPKGLEEEINMLVDAGFHPKTNPILRDCATKIHKRECEVLKRKLNITIGRSTYAFMAVDFAGLLAPDEVHLGFSNAFRDDESGFSDVLLNDMDILVARSPAHLVSDVQKVKAVWKPELQHLKDVIIFPSTGSISLASKLSGGDYDGDIAWVCWDPQIVQLFQNALVPICPDLVAQKWMEQDKTTYAHVVAGSPPDSVSAFLTKSFGFNMQSNFLGICTNFKEEFCYTFNNVDSQEAVFLSTLLSNLVDQAKQGFVFDFEKLGRVKQYLCHGRPLKTPQYKSDRWDGPRSQIRHIVDDLKFNVAEIVVSKTLEDFYKQFPNTNEGPDVDLLQPYKWAKDLAKNKDDVKIIINQLEADLNVVYTAWLDKCPKDTGFGTTSTRYAFGDLVQEIHGLFKAILPASTPVTELMFPMRQVKNGVKIHDEFGPWQLLRASTAYSLNKYGQYVWNMAGKQLCYLKADAGKGIEEGAVVVRDTMYVMLKPDNTFVKRYLQVGRGQTEDEGGIEVEDEDE